MYTYELVKGRVVAEALTLPLFKKLLDTCKYFWKHEELSDSDQISFEANCKQFYYEKTIRRVDLFYQNFGKKDGSEFINDEPMPPLASLLAKIDWDNITRGLPGRFHGDFHFENILFDLDSESFTFLDWRQDFAGDLDVGDIYYDLAKLLHGIIVSHELIAENHFSVDWDVETINYNLYRRQVHVECEKYLEIWCHQNSLDFSKVRILTALIYLNIAALHHHPYSLLLYALGKHMLNHELS